VYAKSPAISKVAAFDINFLRKIWGRLLSHDPQCQAFLFGSRARGDNRFDSDYDLLVLSKNFTGLTPEERWQWFYEKIVLDPQDAALQPQLWTPEEWEQKSGSLLYQEVMRNRISLSGL